MTAVCARGRDYAPLADAPWQPAIHIAFVLAVVTLLVLYAPTYIGLADIWAHTGTFQYAFLIFPIAMALAIGRRDLLAGAVARVAPHGLLALAGLLLFWLIGAAARINLAQHMAVVLVWPVLVYLFYGPGVTRRLLFPLAYLLFAIPFGNFLVSPLQTVTAHLSVLALKLTGVPVLMDGHFINTPAASWHVAEACSGIKFFVALTAFGVLYAHLFYQRWQRRIGFVIAAMVVPIIANALRVYFTILIGEYLGMHYATGTDHLIFGWQFFGAVLLALFLAGWPWHEPPAVLPAAEPALSHETRRRVGITTVAALVLLALPVAWWHVSGYRLASHNPPPTLSWADTPAALTSGRATDETPTALPGVARRTERVYGQGPAAVRVIYLVPEAGRPATDLRSLLFDPGRFQVQTLPASVVLPGAPPVSAVRLTLAGPAERQRVLYAFRLGEHWTTSTWAVRLAAIAARLSGQVAGDGLLVAIGGPDTSADTLDRVIAAVMRGAVDVP